MRLYSVAFSLLRYVVFLYQAGLGLPDEAYYREDAYAAIRDAYRPHVARMLGLSGLPDDDAARAADLVVDLETRLAAHHWDVVKDRDADLTYNPMTLAELAAHAPQFDWGAWAAALGAPDGAMERVVVREPEFAAGCAALWAELPAEQWRAWLRYHLISARAPYLADAVVQANFDFYGRTLTGATELRERWRRGVSLVEGALGEAVGVAVWVAVGVGVAVSVGVGVGVAVSVGVAVGARMVPGGILVADNAINHQATLRPMLDRALQDDRVDALMVPIGKGELLCRRR